MHLFKQKKFFFLFHIFQLCFHLKNTVEHVNQFYTVNEGWYGNTIAYPLCLNKITWVCPRKRMLYYHRCVLANASCVIVVNNMMISLVTLCSKKPNMEGLSV